jgi:hypothetical protein
VLAKRTGATLHASLEHLEVKYRESEKVVESQYFTSKCSELACKDESTFSCRYFHTDPHRAQQEEVDHFAFQFLALKSETRKSEKSARFPRISECWYFFQICDIQLLSSPNWHAK